jgi:hypothetical protein
VRRIDPRLTRLVRKHRRPIAAVLAAAGVLLAVASLRSSTEVSANSAAVPPSGLRPGEVAVPVALASPAIARTLNVGDIIDVVGLAEDADDHARGTVVAPRSRVLEIPDAGSAFGGSSSAVVLLAVNEADALNLSAATADGAVTVLIRTRPTTG